MTHIPYFSVVIPVFDEQDNVTPLFEEIQEVMTGLGKPWEVIWVDDCSRDESVKVLGAICREHPESRLVQHALNCGESAALASGQHCARGELIVTMDADQQNDPHDIPAMLDLLHEDIDAVCGYRPRRQDDLVKRISTKIANGFRKFVTGDRNTTDAGCTMRLMRRSVLAEILVFNGMHRFMSTMLRLQGYRVVEMAINHRPRTRGVSKYGVGNRALRGILDCLAMRWYRRRAVPGRRVQS